LESVECSGTVSPEAKVLFLAGEEVLEAPRTAPGRSEKEVKAVAVVDLLRSRPGSRVADCRIGESHGEQNLRKGRFGNKNAGNKKIPSVVGPAE
jgi:hypothetical protein